MPSRTLATLTVVAAGILAPAAAADAATKYPTVQKITPMTVSVGETMTITGSGYIKGKGKNTVVFRRTGKRAIFAKADGLSSTRLSLVVPAKLRDSFAKQSGKPVATRFQIRILARRFGRSYTTLSKSPTVRAGESKATTGTTPAATTTAAAAPATATAAPAPRTDAVSPPPAPNCDGDSQDDSVDLDDDNDLLADTTEAAIKTNRCMPDTDGDSMQDGWEYQSAVDRNQQSCPKAPANTDPTFDYPRPCQAAMPYPGTRPYTNPLTPDANIDFDGDWITAGYEYRAWKLKGASDASYKALTGPKGMWYSDGKQASVDTAGDVPTDNNCRGMALPSKLPFNGNYNRPEFAVETDDPVDPSNPNGPKIVEYPDLDTAGVVKPEYQIYLPSRGGDDCLNDSERDEDGDFLTNGEELTGALHGPKWWSEIFKEPMFDLAYWGVSKFGGTDWLTADSDGDGSVDALDDEDADDFLNIEEISRGGPIFEKETKDVTDYTGDHSGLWVDPFNPCLPAPQSRSCPLGRPAGKPGAWRPWADNPKQPQVPRWPTYGVAVHSGIVYQDPDLTDDPATTTVDESKVAGPAEIWAPPVAMTQSMPPVHPLPR